MSKNKEQLALLVELVQNNPDLPVRFMYPSYGSDWDFTSGVVKEVKIGFTYEEDDRIYFDDEQEELKYLLEDIYAEELYPDVYNSFFKTFSEEQDKHILSKAEEEFAKIQWTQEIIVFLKES